MDSSTLRALAHGGFQAVPASQFVDLAAWCRDYCEASGDARYCAVGTAFGAVGVWWDEHDEAGGIPSKLADEIETTITRWLPQVLEFQDPADAAPMARALREEVQALLLPPAKWVERGYL